MPNAPLIGLDQLYRDGFWLVPNVYSPEQITEMLRGISEALDETDDDAMRSQAGSVYAARNVLRIFPWAGDIWRQEPLPSLLRAVLGDEFGLVRGLYFDKPPERTWALPLHKDMTIAVRDNSLPSERFCKPTRKAGVPHVEAPEQLLEKMLTARIHLDDVRADNGPLQVVPGSHRTGKRMDLRTVPPHPVFARAGDVLLMRPLLVHGSIASAPTTDRHRRILHLEFAGRRDLPDGYAWHDYLSA